MSRSAPNTLFAPLAKTFARFYRALLGRGSEPSTPTLEVRADLGLARAAERAAGDGAELPQALLGAFSGAPLAGDDARFVGREDPLKRGLGALETWRAGGRIMVAVTGPQGCGISSFLNRLGHDVGAGGDFRRYELSRRPADAGDALALLSGAVGCEQPAETVEQLIAHLNGLSPRVLALDNGHYLAGRIGAAQAPTRVVATVMVATQDRHLWLLGCEEYAWRRLSYVHRAGAWFRDRIELAHFSEDELGRCLSARLQAAGIESEPGADDEPAPIHSLLAGRVAALHKLSNGKPDLAFFYLLDSLAAHGERTTLEDFAALDFGPLKELEGDALFALAEVAAHGRLTSDDHRALFRFGREQSRLLLEGLHHRGLLEREESGVETSYRLTPLYSDAITRHLSNTNHLY